MVQFRAMVTPCMPTCEPVQCDIMDYTGQARTVDSYGRKKRWLDAIPTSLQTRYSITEYIYMQIDRICMAYVDKVKISGEGPPNRRGEGG
jgi:hypothetical protein